MPNMPCPNELAIDELLVVVVGAVPVVVEVVELLAVVVVGTATFQE
jgi:hypothetical protein